MDRLSALAVAKDSIVPLAVLWPWLVRLHISKTSFSHLLA
jgi:hypothetical protein